MSLDTNPVLRYLLGTAGLVVVVAGLRAAAVFFLPLLLALFLTILALPFLSSLRRHRAPAWLAIVLTMLVVVAVLGVVGLVLSLSIEDLTETLPEYEAQVRAATAYSIDWLESHRVAVPREITTEILDLEAMANLVAGAFRGVATALSSFLLVLLTMIFMLWEAVILPGKLRVAERWGPVDLDRWRPIVSRVQRYLILKTLVSLATGVAAAVLVWLAGLDFALFWGFLAFTLNFIPNIGSFFAALPAIALAAVQLGAPRTLVIAAGYLVINLVLGNIVEPALMGRGLRMSPLSIFLALIFWGWVWGPLGMILSVPLTVSLKILFENTESLKWVAVLLDRRPREAVPAPPPAAPAK
jgi:predicted PurR-regulated permease PerM